ncbi:MAG: hypothetical protein JJ992_16435, partial [Planctomycetes bacterium]|nr:hypothetical protein [Planctomycetota bacterium]
MILKLLRRTGSPSTTEEKDNCRPRARKDATVRLIHPGLKLRVSGGLVDVGFGLRKFRGVTAPKRDDLRLREQGD